MKKLLFGLVILLSFTFTESKSQVKGGEVGISATIGVWRKKKESCGFMLWLCKTKIKTKLKFEGGGEIHASFKLESYNTTLEELSNLNTSEDLFLIMHVVNENTVRIYFPNGIPKDHPENEYFEGDEDIVISSDYTNELGFENGFTINKGKYKIKKPENGYAYVDVSVHE